LWRQSLTAIVCFHLDCNHRNIGTKNGSIQLSSIQFVSIDGKILNRYDELVATLEEKVYPKIYHYEQGGVLQLVLQINFWIAKDTCNSQYLYTMNVNGQVAWIAKLQLVVYMVQLITIQLKSSQNN